MGTCEEELAGSVPFFIVVGVLTGFAAASTAWLLSLFAPPLVTGAIIVIILLAVSGCLHMDGLTDTADGFLSSRPKDRILEIMKDSHIGAMGVIAALGVILLKFSSLSSLQRVELCSVVFLMPVAGRSAIVIQIAVLPYVRPGGLGSVFCRTRPYFSAVLARLF